MSKLSVEQAQMLNTRYAGRHVGIVSNGRYRGTEWGYLLVITESGFVYFSEDFRREFFKPWEEFSRFSSVGEPKAMKAARYNRNNHGKFSKTL